MEKKKNHLVEIAIQIPDVETIVRQAMTEKRNHYDKDTVFGAMVKNSLQQAAQEVMKEWIDENRQLFKDALVKEMSKGKAARIRQFAENIAAGICRVHLDRVAFCFDDED